MRGERAQRLAIFAAGLLAVAVALLVPVQESSTGPPSTFRAGRGGALALYLVAEGLGIPVSRWTRPTEDLQGAGAPRALVLLEPSVRLHRLEAGDLVRWLEEGGRLVYAPRRERDPRDRPDPLLLALDVRTVEGEAEAFDPPDLGPFPLAPEAAERWPDLAPQAGERRVALRAPAGALPVYADAGGAAALVRLDVGAGEVLLVAGAEGLTNETLEDDALALPVLRALDAWGGAAFDELHHGHAEVDHAWSALGAWLADTRPGRALLALAAVALVAVVARGVRHGGAVPPELPPGRSSLEHARALAAAWSRARAVARPARELALGLRLALGPDVAGRLTELAAAQPDLAPDVERLLGALEGRASARGDLAAVAAAADRVRAVAEGAAAGRGSRRTEGALS